MALATVEPGRPVTGPACWHAADFPEARRWVRGLSPAMLDDIDRALGHARRAGRAFHEVTPADFPLGETAALLSACRADLLDGPGFAVVGGLPVERYGYDDAVLAYAGLSAHLGRLVSQSYRGAMKVDVTDLGLPYGRDVRGYSTRAPLRFHTDGALLTGLLCLEEAAEGGLSILASAAAAHNAVLAERPDLYPVLLRGFHHHRRGEHAPGEPPVSAAPIPVFRFARGLLHVTYDRNQSLWSAEGGIAFTPEDVAAMDALDAVLARPAHQLQMHLARGDVQYVNNFAVLHARTEYRDAPGRKRHLVRLWLEAPGARWSGPTVRELYVADAAGRGVSPPAR